MSPLSHGQLDALARGKALVRKALHCAAVALQGAGAMSNAAGFEAGRPPPGGELDTIETYARFLQRHPEMPESHRAWFLRQIVRSCQAAHGGPRQAPHGNN